MSEILSIRADKVCKQVREMKFEVQVNWKAEEVKRRLKKNTGRKEKRMGKTGLERRQ